MSPIKADGMTALEKVFGEVDPILIRIHRFHNAPYVRATRASLSKVYNSALDPLACAVNNDEYPGSIGKHGIASIYEPQLLGVQEDKGADGEYADHIYEEFKEKGVQLGARPFHHYAEGFVRRQGYSRINPG